MNSYPFKEKSKLTPLPPSRPFSLLPSPSPTLGWSLNASLQIKKKNLKGKKL